MENMEKSNTIRDAEKADAERLAGLIRSAFRDVAERFGLTAQNCPKHPSNCIGAWIETDFARGVEYFILSQDGAPVGCVGVERAGDDFFYLERLAVLPQKRRQGLGRRLVLHAIEEARSKGAGRIGIGIIAAQRELKQWYERLGFVATATKRFSHLPFEVCLMALPLDRVWREEVGRQA